MEQEFRWVKAQQACSPFEVFKLLQIGCQKDAEDRREIALAAGDPVGFKVTPGGTEFLVLREGNRISSSVLFKWDANGIVVYDAEDRLMLRASLVVNDEGECRLKVEKEELTFWQFRKRALQDLFFNFQFPN
jgi:predicted polyphosphate/ATP-dependent NAD kinase